MGSKSTLVYHDVTMASLFGPDSERLRQIARAEVAIAKTHSSTLTLQPLHVFFTSNERLHNHVIRSDRGIPRQFSSDATFDANKRVSVETVRAIRARFLELYIASPPLQDPEDLELAAGFDRQCFVAGMFHDVMNLLELHDASDFHSRHLYCYVLAGLEKNVDWVADLRSREGNEYDFHLRLGLLRVKYGVAETPRADVGPVLSPATSVP